MQYPGKMADAPVPQADWRARAAEVASLAAAAAAASDRHGSFPTEETAALATGGLLLAPFPSASGGADLWRGQLLCDVLRMIGRGSLPLGRLYEGHVNAVGLIVRYGRPDQIERFAAEAARGVLFGVWNTEPADDPLRLEPVGQSWRLTGRKMLASGAGFIGRPLVTARLADGGSRMVIPSVELGTRADLSAWRMQGMRASATGSLDFTGLAVEPGDLLGEEGDYTRQPVFSAGAWRFAAVQTGGIEALVDAMRDHLRRANRLDDPHQAARLAEAASAVATARLWSERAADLAECRFGPPERIVAIVNLARLAVERAGMEVIQLVQRSVGLAGFAEGHPLERLMRDLAVYLRQPKPDEARAVAGAYLAAAEASTGELW